MKEPVFINEEFKCFVWLPPRTGSTRAWKIFEKMGFRYKVFNDSTKSFENYDYKFHNHFHQLFEGHENYKLITLLRNPYSRLVSQFRVTSVNFKGDSVDEERYERFEHFLQNVFYNDELDDNICWWYRPTREADYFIRQESNYSGFCSLPFIKETEVYKTGELVDLCATPLHTLKGDEVPWTKFYNQNSADIVYFNTAHYFEKYGYDKNSWKIK